MHPGMQLMQDGPPGHSAQYTRQELQERGITVITWPAYSPDLNPIETLWNKM
jgi:transposase